MDGYSELKTDMAWVKQTLIDIQRRLDTVTGDHETRIRRLEECVTRGRGIGAAATWGWEKLLALAALIIAAASWLTR